MEEADVKDLELKRSGVSNKMALSESDNLLFSVSSSFSSTLTDDAFVLDDRQSSGHGNNTTSFRQLGASEVDAGKAVNRTQTNEEIEQMPKLLGTTEPEKSTKNGKFNLRKSLAWDSAFFTSDGVLDAEELSTMIEGGEKSVKHQLPGIEEEVYRSMDSISTLESDNLTLECLEAELFQDIRASIQKSSGASKLTNSSTKALSGKKDSQAKISSSSKKADPTASSKKVEPDSIKRPAVRIKDSTSSIPQPPKIIIKGNPTSELTMKRASLSANHLKKDLDIAKQALVTQKRTEATKVTTQALKLTRVSGPRRAVPKPSSISKSSLLGSSTGTKIERTKSSSSFGSSGSSSGNDVKSSTTFSRRKVDPKTGKLPAGSIPKTASRISLKNKAPPANSSLSSHLVPSNLSPSISPASSISEWSESSSSTSTVNRGSTSRASIDTTVSHRSLDSDASVESSLNIHPTGRNMDPNGKVALPPSQTSSLSRPSGVQPTGLRMPSPKIGFFDAGKSGSRTPNGAIRSQPRLPTSLLKTGGRCSPTGSNGAKIGKVPPPKTVAAHTNLKPTPQKTSSPKPSQEQTNSKPKPSSVSRGLKNCLVTSPEVPDKKSEKDAPRIETSVQGTDSFNKIEMSPAEDSTSESSLNICTNSSHLEMLENGQLEMPKKEAGGSNDSYVEFSSDSDLFSNELKPNPQNTTSPKPSQEQTNTKPKPSSASRGFKSSLVTSPEVAHKKSETDALRIEISTQGIDNFNKIEISPAEDCTSESSLNICINASHVETPEKAVGGNNESCVEFSSDPKLCSNELKPNSEKITSPKSSGEKTNTKPKPSSASRGVKSCLVASPEVPDKKSETDDLRIEISAQETDDFNKIKISPAEDGTSESTLNICINSSHVEMPKNDQLEMPKETVGCFEFRSEPEPCSNELNPNSQKTTSPKPFQEETYAQPKVSSALRVIKSCTSPEVLDKKTETYAPRTEVSMQGTDSLTKIEFSPAEDGISESSLNICTNSSHLKLPENGLLEIPEKAVGGTNDCCVEFHSDCEICSNELKPCPQKITSPKPSQEQANTKPKPSSASRGVKSCPEVPDKKSETDAQRIEISTQGTDSFNKIKISPVEGESNLTIFPNSSHVEMPEKAVGVSNDSCIEFISDPELCSDKLKTYPQKTTSPKPSQEQTNTNPKPSSASRGVQSCLVTSPEVPDKKSETEAPRTEISTQDTDNFNKLEISPAEKGISVSSCTNSFHVEMSEIGQLEMLEKEVAGSNNPCVEFNTEPELCSNELVPNLHETTSPIPSQEQTNTNPKPSSASRGVQSCLVTSPEVPDKKSETDALRTEINFNKLEISPAEDGINESSCANSSHVEMLKIGQLKMLEKAVGVGNDSSVEFSSEPGPCSKSCLVTSPEVPDKESETDAPRTEISTQDADNFNNLETSPAEASISASNSNICINSSHLDMPEIPKKAAGDGNDSYVEFSSVPELCSNEYLVADKESKSEKSVLENSRTPFAVKNEASGIEVSEKISNFAVLESENDENSEVV